MNLMSVSGWRKAESVNVCLIFTLLLILMEAREVKVLEWISLKLQRLIAPSNKTHIEMIYSSTSSRVPCNQLPE